LAQPLAPCGIGRLIEGQLSEHFLLGGDPVGPHPLGFQQRHDVPADGRDLSRLGPGGEFLVEAFGEGDTDLLNSHTEILNGMTVQGGDYRIRGSDSAPRQL
jgi:hypothetical protein